LQNARTASNIATVKSGKSKVKNSRKEGVRTSARSGGLVLIDGEPARKKARKEYEKVINDLERTRVKIALFHELDHPQYKRWFHAKFGALLTEMREVDSQLRQHRELILEIQAEMFFSAISPGQAYKRVMRRKEEREIETDHSESDQQEGPDPDPFGGKNDFTRDQEDARDDSIGNERRPEKKGPQPGRLKELYRALVRQLHPDAQSEMTPQRREWWHQVQEAYQKSDVEQLEVILSLCQMNESGTTRHTSVSILMRITKRLKLSLRKLRAEFNLCRRDPAWGFSQRTDLHSLRVQTQRLIDEDLVVMRSELEQLQRQLAQWSKQTRSRRSQPGFFRGFADDLF
jgi:hypothetical protein